ncbi:PREDICTED: zinc finger BED domain-containing protein RICESLEEPER 2-like, partial [Nicotiana attenuata]|uniref:zinc finger BED domain-containing protein RICESLEEPER 2-like n=1 Tax=Nicotiana attenuata TaxID=49451 RepID=UPI000904702F
DFKEEYFSQISTTVKVQSEATQVVEEVVVDFDNFRYVIHMSRIFRFAFLSVCSTINQRKLKELLGHTPSQVFGGALLGIICYNCTRSTGFSIDAYIQSELKGKSILQPMQLVRELYHCSFSPQYGEHEILCLLHLDSYMAENIQSDKVMMGESGASNSNATSQAQTTESNITKKRRKRSVVWDHFTEIITSEGSTKAKCDYCFIEYVFKTKDGTSTLLSHMLKCPKRPAIIDKKQSNLGFQSAPGGSQGDVAVVTWKFEQEECRKALCRMVIVDELPFSFVEKEGFRDFMKVAQPYFRIPSRSTVTRDCFDLFNEEKQKLKRFFIETKQRVCITTDTWTSIQRINYMCITAHWIDSEWNMHKRIINFCPIINHKGDDIANGIGRCLREWGINKIFTVTVDNASSNDVTVKELSKQLTKMGTNLINGTHLHVRCMAHIMNLVVQDGLKESSVSIERVRHAVRYVRQSPARLKRFQECFDTEQLNSKKTLCLDVPTRWNSTYLMLRRAVEFESELLSSDWENVKRITKFLEIFYLLTLKISGSRYVTSNIHFLEICAVAIYLKQLIANEDVVLSEMAKNMKEKFDKYWGDPGKMNKIIFISCILDPRYKIESVGFALVKMFGVDPGATIQAEVTKYMTSLFSEYVKSGLSGSQASTQNIGLLESLMQDIKKI